MRLGHYLALLYFICNLAACHALNAIWAVNCGGNAHVDLNGVKYDADFNVRGIPSGHGLNLIMHRAPVEDAVLYQTERYDTSTFSYEFPMPESGSYVLHLKFSEVWFQIPNGKVFSVELNGGLRIIDDLDIFQTVGFSTAHDVNIPLEIEGNAITYGSSTVQLKEGEHMKITFVKGPHDNPKVNAIALFEDQIEDIPKLPSIALEFTTPIPEFDTIDEHEEPDAWLQQEQDAASSRKSIPAIERPPAPDPYATMDTLNYIIPVVITLCALLPVVLYMCKL